MKYKNRIVFNYSWGHDTLNLKKMGFRIIFFKFLYLKKCQHEAFTFSSCILMSARLWNFQGDHYQQKLKSPFQN